MNFSLDDMAMFVAVVNTQSISRGAEALGLPKSNISRRLKQLEDKLNVRLIERTTRSQKLTEAGETFYRGCVKILSQSETLENTVQQKQHAMAGKLTVFAPLDTIHMLFKTHMCEFAKLYPELEIEFLSGATRPHLLKDKIDVMIHLNSPQDSSFIARKLTNAYTSYYASPAYLEQYGTPQVPEDLLKHRCITNLNQDREALPWSYIDKDKIVTLPIKPHYQTDSSLLSKTLVEQGLGICLLPCFLCKEEERDGTLIKLFDGQCEINDALYALYPSRDYMPEKTRIFLDFLQGVLVDQI